MMMLLCFVVLVVGLNLCFLSPAVEGLRVFTDQEKVGRGQGGGQDRSNLLTEHQQASSCTPPTRVYHDAPPSHERLKSNFSLLLRKLLRHKLLLPLLVVETDQRNILMGRPVNERLETLGDAWLNYYAGFVVFQARGRFGFCWLGVWSFNGGGDIPVCVCFSLGDQPTSGMYIQPFFRFFPNKTTLVLVTLTLAT